MKVAYLSVHRDGTGYAHQAINNLLAIEAGGIDIVARAIRLSRTPNNELAARVQHLEQKTTDNVDVVIQHILPHMFEYKAGVKNIGMICWETSHFLRSNWPHCCNMMDEIWVPSLQSAKAVEESNVNVPVRILPCACDQKRFANPPSGLDIPQLKNKCVFYTIGEMTRRKNIIATLRAFYTAFSMRDDVALVIKTNVPGQTPQESIETLQNTINDVKKSLHTYVRHPYYPPVLCITDFLSEQKLDQLHMSCDVFVSASHGEAWGIPAHDAMGFGRPAILSNWGSYPELMYAQASRYWKDDAGTFMWPGNIDCGWLVYGQLTPCFGQTDSFPDLYTGKELWFDPNVVRLAVSMNEAYKEWGDGSLSKRGLAASKRAVEFSYDKVGATANALLNSGGG
jgi:glycosyltransferase involved in cell wall biosynthesis